MKKAISIGKIFALAAIIIILAAVVVSNVFCGIYRDIISVYFYGYGMNTSGVKYDEYDKVCQQIEAEGVVLLKNENKTLPFDDVTKLNVFGWGATDNGFIYTGSGSGATDNHEAQVTFLQGLKRAGFEYNTELINKYTSYKKERSSSSFFDLIEPPASEIKPLIANAKKFSDAAIVVISRSGREQFDLPREQSKFKTGNDASRSYLQISTEEEALIALVTENFERVAVILNTCNAMETGFLDDDGIGAALAVGATGQSGTIALGKILSGETNPSGKLADTYAYDHTTAPSYANSANGSAHNSAKGGIHSYAGVNDEYYVDYCESIYIGYKWYETADREGFWSSAYAAEKWGVACYDDVVQYPFGFGLSYSDFKWSVKDVSPANGAAITADTEISVTVEVENTSDVAGMDVVQLYYGADYYEYGIEKSYKNLVAFEKTPLISAHGKETVTLSFTASDMKSYDSEVNGCYVMEEGDYSVWVQTDSHRVADDRKSSISYYVKDDIIIDYDEKTEAEVKNRFTGDEATDGGISIDGSNTNQNINYICRADFTRTFPEITTGNRAKTFATNTALPTGKNTDKTFTQSSGGGLKLYTKNEDDKEVLNEELVVALGSDYDDPKWKELLDQLTPDDLWDLVGKGGYGTVRIDNIGKPKFLDLDGPAGINDSNMTDNNAKTTYYPIETVIACTWNKALAELYGKAIGGEANDIGSITGWYAPAVNIHRSPFDGRNYEYYSEDGYLSGMLAASTINGAASQGLYCYIKHFVLNETENHRQGLFTWLTEQTLRETYLKPFELAVKEGGANAVMSSFNRIGATWTGGSYALLTEVLRDEWGFKGTVVTDYVNDSNYQNVDIGIRAGNDLYLCGLKVEGSDKTSATALACARESCHNILYTYCNTISRAEVIVGKSAGDAKAHWVWVLVAVDIIAAAALAVWVYFLFFKKDKVLKTTEPPEADSTTADGPSNVE